MASLKDIRNRINSVRKTQKTTSAMKMVSAAKLRRAEEAAKSAQPYSEELRKVVSSLSARFSGDEVPLFRQTEGNRTAIIVLTSDRGLCGGFNMNLCKAANAMLEREGVATADVYVFGRKGNEFFKRSGHTVVEVFTEVPEHEELKAVQQAIDAVANRFLEGDLDRVYLAYNTYVSVISQRPTLNTLFPVTPPEETEDDEREVIFEPSAQAILNTLLEKYVQNQVYTSLLETHAGEHAARMTAMDSATKNAGEMIDKLQLFYNRTRQAAITKELIEIISGAESL